MDVAERVEVAHDRVEDRALILGLAGERVVHAAAGYADMRLAVARELASAGGAGPASHE
jgi:hypothetical protein